MCCPLSATRESRIDRAAVQRRRRVDVCLRSGSVEAADAFGRAQLDANSKETARSLASSCLALCCCALFTLRLSLGGSGQPALRLVELSLLLLLLRVTSLCPDELKIYANSIFLTTNQGCLSDIAVMLSWWAIFHVSSTDMVCILPFIRSHLASLSSSHLFNTLL